jgi:hypothetical protein
MPVGGALIAKSFAFNKLQALVIHLAAYGGLSTGPVSGKSNVFITRPNLSSHSCDYMVFSF